MGWYDNFKTLTNLEGTSQSEISRNIIIDEFEEYFNNAPNKLTGTIDGTSREFVIQNIKYGENVGDEKLALVLPSTPFVEGSIVSFNGNDWLAFNKENRAVNSHIAYKIDLLNNSLSWKDKFGTTYTHKCVLKTKPAFAGFEQTEITVVDNRAVAIVKRNSDTELIALNQRFIFSNKWAYRVVNIDDMTSQEKGVIVLSLERVQVNEDLDDLANNIAYITPEDETPVGTDGVQFTLDELRVRYGTQSSVEVYNYVGGIPQADVFTFRVDGIDSSKYEIVATTGNSITIKGLGYVYTGQLVAIDSLLAETSIPLTLDSVF